MTEAGRWGPGCAAAVLASCLICGCRNAASSRDVGPWRDRGRSCDTAVAPLCALAAKSGPTAYQMVLLDGLRRNLFVYRLEGQQIGLVATRSYANDLALPSDAAIPAGGLTYRQSAELAQNTGSGGKAPESPDGTGGQGQGEGSDQLLLLSPSPLSFAAICDNGRRMLVYGLKDGALVLTAFRSREYDGVLFDARTPSGAGVDYRTVRGLVEAAQHNEAKDVAALPRMTPK